MISISISTKKMFNRLLAGYHPHPIWPVRMPLNLSYTLAIRCYSSLWTCQVETPNIPCSKSHIHTPSPLSFQSIRPNPRSYVTFRNKLFFTVRSCWPLSQPPSWKTRLVGRQLLLIQYIGSYPPYLEAVSSIPNQKTRHALVRGSQITWLLQTLNNFKKCFKVKENK